MVGHSGVYLFLCILPIPCIKTLVISKIRNVYLA